MPKMHSKQPGCLYSLSEPFTKNTERTKKFKETGGSTYINQNKLDKACFQHDYSFGRI